MVRCPSVRTSVRLLRRSGWGWLDSSPPSSLLPILSSYIPVDEALADNSPSPRLISGAKLRMNTGSPQWAICRPREHHDAAMKSRLLFARIRHSIVAGSKKRSLVPPLLPHSIHTSSASRMKVVISRRWRRRRRAILKHFRGRSTTGKVGTYLRIWHSLPFAFVPRDSQKGAKSMMIFPT